MWTAETLSPIPEATRHRGRVAAKATAWIVRRRYPLAGLVGWLTVGFAFLLWWNPVMHHAPTWTTGGDVWGIFRGAQYVEWGSLGSVYNAATGVVALPGMEILLAPVAMVADHFHLTESFGPLFVARPTAALLLMPAEYLLGSSVLFMVDTFAERMQMIRSRRVLLCSAVAVVGWPAIGIWGHAEDLVAVALLGWALLAHVDRRWKAMGWLLGFGIAVQPLVGLAVPLLLAATPRGRRVTTGVRVLVLPAFLAAVAFLGDARDAWRQLVEQPTPPAINHATPWSLLAPKLEAARTITRHTETLTFVKGHVTYVSSIYHGPAVYNVSGGAGRLLYVALAVLIGLFVWRRPQPVDRVLWLAAAVLAGRVFFEPVMTPYYLAPPLVLCLILAARRPTRVFAAAAVIAAELTVFAYFHLNMWVWWAVVVVGMAGLVALCYPVAGTGIALGSEINEDELDRSSGGSGMQPSSASPPAPVLV